MESVIRSHFNDLRRKKATREGRDISVRAVARETNLSLPTVQRVASSDSEGLSGVKLGTIEVLSKYFGVGIGELIERVDD
ncbi:XRE family transcriptional regulator [bacterium]|nr:MAG: XRE family transcriptional regulator [bacterium]